MIKTLAYIAAARAARGLGATVPPHLMTYNITDRCNARCAMCEIHTWDASAGDELTAEQFSAVLSYPELKSLEVVRITGGEPFLRKDLPDFFTAIKNRTKARVVYITTNGSFPDRIEPLVETSAGGGPLLHLQLSIDALDERHDAMRGVAGFLDKALSSLETVAKMKKKHRFYAGINQTVTGETLDQVEPVNQLARKLGLGHHIFLGAQFHEGKSLGSADPSRQELSFSPLDGMSRADLETFYRLHRQLKRSAGRELRKDFFSSLLRDVSEEYLNEGGRNRALRGVSSPHPPCTAMFTHFRLSAPGEVFACSAFRDRPAGNVKDRPFREIWRGKDADELRKTVKRCKGCWIECDINPSIFFSGNIIPWFVSKMAADPEFRRSYSPIAR